MLDNPPLVSVVIGYEAGQTIPHDIAIRTDEHITQVTGRKVLVRVGFMEMQQTA